MRKKRKLAGGSLVVLLVIYLVTAMLPVSQAVPKTEAAGVLTLRMTASPQPAAPGDTIDLVLTVKNAGTAPAAGVALQAPGLGLSQTLGTLQPGAEKSVKAACQVKEADLPGPLTFAATASSTDGASVGASVGIELTAPDPVTPAAVVAPQVNDLNKEVTSLDISKDVDSVTAGAPVVTLEKTASESSIEMEVGETHQVQFTVQVGASASNGAYSISGDIFVDNDPDWPALVTGVSDTVWYKTLASGGTWLPATSDITTDVPSSIPVGAGHVYSYSGTFTLPVPLADVTSMSNLIEITISNHAPPPGETHTFHYREDFDKPTAGALGSATLQDIETILPGVGLTQTIDSIELNGVDATFPMVLDLAAAPYTVVITKTLTATAAGDYVLNNKATLNGLEDEVDVNIHVDEETQEQRIGLELVKDVCETCVAIGDTVHYTITVRNTGNVDLHNVWVEDALCGLDEYIGTLAPGAQAVFYCEYGPLTETDYLNRPLVNTAYAGADEVAGVNASRSVNVTADPALTLEKTADVAEVEVGGSIAYTIIVRNDGNITLHNVHVVDAKLGIDETIPALAAGAQAVFLGDYGPVTAADMPLVENLATADTQEGCHAEAGVTVTVVQPVTPQVTGAIMGNKWHDVNGDGRHTADEPGLAGITITLEGTGIDESATTGANGSYSFTDLPAGEYVVRELTPEGWMATVPTVRTVKLASGETREGIDFMNVRVSPVVPTIIPPGPVLPGRLISLGQPLPVTGVDLAPLLIALALLTLAGFGCLGAGIARTRL
ncbi:MAG: DUF7507 domain-containing protein [Candidatus Geothermincolia bacterium]